MSVLARRSDFQWLGHAWLQQLAFEDRARRVWVPSGDKGLKDLPWAVASALATRLVPLEDPISWITREATAFRLDRLVAALLPIAHHSGPTTAGSLLGDVILKNFVDTSGLPRAIVDSNTLVSKTLSLALSKQANIADWFSATWKDCFAVRDRLRHASSRTATEGRDPSALALACGSAVIARWNSAQERADTLGELWDAMRVAVVETSLTTSNAPESTVSVAARQLALTFSAMYKSSDNATRKMRLTSLLSPLTVDANEYAELVYFLVKGGTTVPEIDAAIPGPSVKKRFERILDDAQRRRHEGYVQLQTLERLQNRWREISGSGS